MVDSSAERNRSTLLVFPYQKEGTGLYTFSSIIVVGSGVVVILGGVSEYLDVLLSQWSRPINAVVLCSVLNYPGAGV